MCVFQLLHIVAWSKPPFPNRESLTREEYDNLPYRIWVREVDVTIERRGFRTKKVIVATSLTDSAVYTKGDLAELFLRRWEAELNLRHLKTTLKMEMLKSKTPTMVYKEVWAHLLVYNLIRRVMWKAAMLSHVPPLRISFKGTIDHINAFLPQLSAATVRKSCLYELLLWTISQDLVPRREERIYQRCIKRRHKPFPYMTTSRSEYRATMLN